MTQPIQEIRMTALITKTLSLVLIILLFAACVPVTEPSTQSEEVAMDDTGLQGTLRFGHHRPPRSWNPHRSSSPSENLYFQVLFDTLVNEQPDGSLAPSLATEWTQTADAIDFVLRDDVVFHDGTSFDAEVAKANILSVRDGDFPALAEQLNAIASVDVADATHLRLTLSRPDPTLLGDLARQAGYMLHPDELDLTDEIPIGTGPWQFNADDSIMDATYVFDLYENFWDPSQQGVSRVEFYMIADAIARANALKSDELDATWIDPSDRTDLEAGGFEVLQGENVRAVLMILDREGTLIPALGDVQVRRALSHAIDRETFIAISRNGVGFPLMQYFLPGQLGYVEDIKNFGYDPELAKQLLAEAGAENFSVTMAQNKNGRVLFEPLFGFLEDVGITVDFELIKGSIPKEVANGTRPLMFTSFNGRHPESYYDSFIAADGIYNPFGIVEADLDELATQAKLLPEAEAAPLWAEIMKASIERGIVIPIGEVTTPVAVSANVQGASLRYFMPTAMQIRGVTVEP